MTEDGLRSKRQTLFHEQLCVMIMTYKHRGASLLKFVCGYAERDIAKVLLATCDIAVLKYHQLETVTLVYNVHRLFLAIISNTV